MYIFIFPKIKRGETIIFVSVKNGHPKMCLFPFEVIAKKIIPGRDLKHFPNQCLRANISKRSFRLDKRNIFVTTEFALNFGFLDTDDRRNETPS